MGESTAKMNVSDLRKMLGQPDQPSDDESMNGSNSKIESVRNSTVNTVNSSSHDNASRKIRVRRQSMEQLDLIQVLFCFYFIIFCTLLHLHCVHTSMLDSRVTFCKKN